uniref:Uncharacterized protein n=1 Tax=Anguilla anguilla TaxID=7936 RepID=A0A0E9VHK9_ANGAN
MDCSSGIRRGWSFFCCGT